MSGGVDSSTAAWFLKEEGYEVIGATMCIGMMDKAQGVPARCCGLTDIEDARRVALQLEIPFYVFHLREEFEREVIQYFCEEYMKGRTPNPCILCNEKIKFGFFLEKALELKADFIATGHYARLVYDKPESQEVCFIHESSYDPFLSERLKESIEHGPILDKDGKVLGRHKGIPFYTIGQRRGLRLAKGKPLYVIGIDRGKNAIIVGGEEEVYRDTFMVDSVHWVIPHKKNSPMNAQVKIRYNHPGSEAILSPKGEDEAEVRFKSPQKAITPGQAAVFYDGETVMGGGWIREVIN